MLEFIKGFWKVWVVSGLAFVDKGLRLMASAVLCKHGNRLLDNPPSVRIDFSSVIRFFSADSHLPPKISMSCCCCCCCLPWGCLVSRKGQYRWLSCSVSVPRFSRQKGVGIHMKPYYSNRVLVYFVLQFKQHPKEYIFQASILWFEASGGLWS